MMQHVLVSKGAWNIVQDIDVCLGFVDAGSVEDVVGSFIGAGVVCSTTASAGVRLVLSIAKQICWDSEDSQAHAVISLPIKNNITPFIHSARTTRQAWDILASLHASRNEAKISYLCKELESKIMQEDDDMNFILSEVKDLKEKLIFVGEVIPNHSLVQAVLDALPQPYQTFASTWRVVIEDIEMSNLDVESMCVNALWECKRYVVHKR
ncbi:hypothetical protein L7F22_018648 [Adiantum nelumboides]|nr:hypothetical protein [Adiantum nelumboides]